MVISSCRPLPLRQRLRPLWPPTRPKPVSPTKGLSRMRCHLVRLTTTSPGMGPPSANLCQKRFAREKDMPYSIRPRPWQPWRSCWAVAGVHRPNQAGREIKGESRRACSLGLKAGPPSEAVLMEQHPFDPTVKTLAELSPADWLPLVRRRRRRVTIEDSDVGTMISGATDKLFRVHDEPEYLLHLNFEAGRFRSDLPLRLRLYNSVFEYRHECVVLSVPVLLVPAADSPQWNGL